MSRDICMKNLEHFARRGLSFPWNEKDCYASWLSQTFHFVSHSTRLIALAASRFYRDKDSLHNRFLEHISEEKFHERLALKDLKNLGVEISDYPELAITKGFYQSQYYQIERESPESFLGYILALEGMAVLAGEKVFQVVSKTFGSPASNFIRVHAQEDKEHIESAFEHLLTLDPTNYKKAFNNFIQSGELYISMLDQIQERYSVGKDQNRTSPPSNDLHLDRHKPSEGARLS